MPLFASYGILTAIMIALALAASMLVLPAILVLAAGTTKKSLSAD
jgi:predicted RND superfamily exporter protein